MAAKAAPAATKRPDFNGVPGKLVAAPEGLQFGPKGRHSPYDSLLQQLATAKSQVLEFGDARAKASVYSRATKLGMKVEFAERGVALYVRFGGWKPDSEQWRKLARVAILEAIKTQPRMVIQVTNAVRATGLNDVDAGTIDAILKQMEQEGTVARQRDGSWALKPQA